MITKEVRQSPLFAEFSPEEQDRYFNLSKEKVTNHVDTLYYTVKVYGDSNEPSENMQALLEELGAFRTKKAFNPSLEVILFGLSVEVTRFVHYEFCLRKAEEFDIFISSILPNDVTPRIVVQLRSHALVLDGVCQTVCKSFRFVEAMLANFGLEVETVTENRIDYAYHTNLIQNPYKYFTDEMLLSKLKTKLRTYHKVGEIGKKIEIDYLSFGHRNSNDIFVRIYNKSREVIEKNYKSFFLDKWLADKLISQYDYECYLKAFELKSYVTGLLIGRIDWYLEHGTNEEIKKKLLDVKTSAYVNSDNTDRLRAVVDELLPPVTLILNIEFQTKRKFYVSMEDFIQSHGVSYCEKLGRAEWLDEKQFPLLRLFIVYALRSEICQYLTTTSLSFVENKGKKEERLSRWWQRISDSYIEEYDKHVLDVWRTHEQHSNLKKTQKRLMGAVASVSILKNNGFEKSTFMEDVSDVLCSLNDNDFYGFAANPLTGEVPQIEPSSYQTIKKRKERQHRPILKKEEKELEKLKEREKKEDESMCNEQ